MCIGIYISCKMCIILSVNNNTQEDKMSKIIKEVYAMNKRTGYAYGMTVTNELFLGYVNQPLSMEFYKDTDENRRFIKSQYEFNRNYS